MKQRIVTYEAHFWLDDITFVYEFGIFVDEDGDEYLIRFEYWADQYSWHIHRIYEDDTTLVTDEDLSSAEVEEICDKMRKWMEEK